MAESWESILPGLLEAAGITTHGKLAVRPLTGGVSSDIVVVTVADGRQFCAKRALGKLRVAADWRVPTDRNHFEVGWFRRANRIVPGSAPDVLAEDRSRGVSLMSYLPPEQYALWKDELLAGRVGRQTAPAVANAIGRIHAATMIDAGVAADFPTDDLFDALRIDPYLRILTVRHPQLAAQVSECIEATKGNRIALVHGDLSPKNILIAKADGHPVILDAECAWYGDPVFDAAFCLNHLLLKAIHLPTVSAQLIAQAREFFAIWIGHLPAAMREALEGRAARLLPCLLLARVDGKSPVEYLDGAGQQMVRALAVDLIRDRHDDVAAVFDGCAAVLRNRVS
jgi:5-methylthioribose kinase